MLTLKEAENAFRSGEPPGEGSGTFESFLRDYEPKLNEIVRKFLGKRAFDAETFMDYKLACAAAMLERWKDFDAGKGIQFSTFAHHDVMNALLRMQDAGRGWLVLKPRRVQGRAAHGSAHVRLDAARGG